MVKTTEGRRTALTNTVTTFAGLRVGISVNLGNWVFIVQWILVRFCFTLG